MKHILSKYNFNSVLESLKVNINDVIWIHHPITEDLLYVDIVEVKKDKVVVSIPEDSDYYGQPNFEVKKINIIGIKK